VSGDFPRVESTRKGGRYWRAGVNAALIPSKTNRAPRAARTQPERVGIAVAGACGGTKRAMLPFTENQRFASGPTVIPPPKLASEMTPEPNACTAYVVSMPTVVIRPTWLLMINVNHRFPSGPEMISCGQKAGEDIGN
jgi:hypothetical protein